MNSDEPTIPGLPMPGDPEGTVMMPNPAGRRSPVTRVLSRSAPAPEPADAAIGFPVAVGLNPLVAAANPLLNLVARLRATLNHDNPARLLDTLTAAVREFESRLTAQGVPAQDIHMAGYLLCAFLDEVIAGTPWGRSGVLAERNLLLAIHGEAYGGDKAFEVLTRLAEEPARNRDLLGLYYVC